ncbi:MAG: avidin/streptavidin family protein [Trinickia sp.]|jgi:hypothetical protein
MDRNLEEPIRERTDYHRRSRRPTGPHFRTALEDSGFHGQTLSVTGITQGACVNFAFACKTKAGDLLASFSGILFGDRMETVRFVLAHAPDKREPWPHAVATNHDTFARAAKS